MYNTPVTSFFALKNLIQAVSNSDETYRREKKTCSAKGGNRSKSFTKQYMNQYWLQAEGS